MNLYIYELLTLIWNLLALLYWYLGVFTTNIFSIIGYLSITGSPTKANKLSYYLTIYLSMYLYIWVNNLNMQATSSSGLRSRSFPLIFHWTFWYNKHLRDDRITITVIGQQFLQLLLIYLNLEWKFYYQMCI